MGEQIPTPDPETEPIEATVTLSKKEHDQLQAQARRAAKALKDRDEADAKREADERQAAAKAAGDYDEALRIERQRAAEADKRAAAAERKADLADEVARRGFTGSKASLVLKLAGADGGVSEAVEAVVAQYPDLFNVAPTPAPEPTPEPRTPRRAGPATPPAARGGFPAGYISPEEYDQTPQRVRITSKEFQARVALSRDYWPSKVPADSFSVS